MLRANLGHFRISDRTQPTCKRRVHEAARPAVAALRKAAVLSCLDVHSPPFSTCRIFKMFPCQRRTRERRNRFGGTMHSPKVMRDPDAYAH